MERRERYKIMENIHSDGNGERETGEEEEKKPRKPTTEGAKEPTDRMSHGNQDKEEAD
jgi:hypothetical protein